MAYCGYITKIKNVRKHSNADKLLVGECFGNALIVGLDTYDGMLGIYFPTDGKLGIEYCEENNLLRKKDANGNNIGGYLDERRHVSTIKLRGECSDGLFMPLESLNKFTDIHKLKEGDMITTLGGTLICEKYIPRRNPRNSQGSGNGKGKKKKKVTVTYPYFEEHIDTSQLVYNLHQFKEGDLCYITLKQHGTSGRSTYTIKEKKLILPYFIYTLFNKLNIKLPIKKTWEYVSGSRRVVLDTFGDKGYYKDEGFREKWHNYFIGKLHKGENIFYEIVGWVNENTTIMPVASNKKVNDKAFVQTYGETTTFSYGCNVGENDIYVYRMTKTDEDGNVVEYPFHLVKLRCEQMGVKPVLELDKFLYTTEEDLMQRVNKHVDGVDPIGKTHVREGIVVRIENKEKFSAYKHKNVSFKILESIIKAEDIIDIEEMATINEESN